MMNSNKDEVVEGKPICFITIDEEDKFHVNPECVKILEATEEDIGVVCVAGPYRSGKSFLCSRLVGVQKGFHLGSTQKPCTKGIWIWDRPIKIQVNGITKTIIVMDTEGLMDPFASSKERDVKIFTLSLLLSSYFIFNKFGPIDARSLAELSFILNITKMIKIKKQGMEEKGDDQSDEYVEYFPSFIWCARDWVLKLEDEKTKEKITCDEYLEKCLSPIQEKNNNKKIHKINNIKNMIRKCFRKRKCFLLVRPLNDEKDLQNIEEFEYDELRPDFIDGANNLVDVIYKDINEMKIKNPSEDKESLMNVNGRCFAYLAKYYVNKINNGDIPDFVESFEAISERECSFACEKAIKLYREMIIAKTKDEVFEVEELMKIHSECLEQTISFFKQFARGDEIIFNKHLSFLNESIIVFSEKERKVIGGELMVILHNNKDKSKKLCEELKVKLTLEFLTQVNYNQIETAQQFAIAFDEVVFIFNSLAKGPSKSEIEKYFINEIRLIKDNFILDKRIEEKEEQILKQQIEKEEIKNEMVITKEKLEQNKAERKAFQKGMELEINTMKEKSELEKELLMKHHNETLKKLEKEWKNYSDQQQKELANEIQNKMENISVKHKKNLRKIKNKNEEWTKTFSKQREQVDNEINQLKIQSKEAQREIEQARIEREESRKSPWWAPILVTAVSATFRGVVGFFAGGPIGSVAGVASALL